MNWTFFLFQMILRLSSLRMLAPLLVLLFCAGSVNSLAVMSVDLGTEWMKIAVVSVTIFNLFR